MKITHIVFDWDGTLADTYPIISEAYDYAFEKTKVKKLSYEEIKRVTAGMQNKDIWARLFGNMQNEGKSYYTEYNQKHPQRYEGLIGLGFTKREQEENYAIYKYATDKGFRDYVNQTPIGDEAESMMCQVDLTTELENYEEQFIVNDF